MKNKFALNQLRILRKTKSRFISIFVIVFLGASFFAGLRHTPFIMQHSMNSYLQEYEVQDLNLISTLAFSDDDIKVILANEQVSNIDKGNVFDALIVEEDSKGVSVYTSETFDSNVSQLEINEGRLPKLDNECVMDYQMMHNFGYELGDEITLETAQGSKAFNIVGFVSDTRFIASLERGSNSLGDGVNNGFVHILSEENTHLIYPDTLYELREEDVLYNDLRIRLHGTEEMSLFSEEYLKYVETVEYELNLVLSERFIDLYDSIVEDANAEIDTYLREYDEGELLYTNNLLDFNNEINNAKLELLNAKEILVANQSKLLEAQQLMGDELAGRTNEIGQLQANIKELQEILNALLENPEDVIIDGDLSDEYQESIDEILGDAQTTLDNLQIMLAHVMSLQEVNIQLEKAQLELELAETELSKNELLADQEFELAREELELAYSQITQAQQDVASIPTGELYILSRNENIGIMSFAANTDSIDALSLVFPLMFFLVAALVTLTSMTRMIEEQRLQNGTMRALGYDKKDVIMQYVVYSFFVTFVATLLGIFFGVYFFAWLIYFLYTSILYGVSAPIQYQFDLWICLQTLFISVVITMGVSLFVSYTELKSTPAELLRPKAPKMGKRIFIEKITWLWKRLSFNQKVTLRNLFRYKKRFLMLIIGIGGCTALMVAGFGLRNSIDGVVSRQYGEVWTYDGIVSFDDNYTAEKSEEIEKELLERSEIDEVKSFYQQMIMIDGEETNHQGVLVVPNQMTGLDDMIHLENGTTKEEVQLSDDGIVINQKLSEILGVEVNDSITITIQNKKYEVEVQGIYDIYYMHYIFMSDTLYEELSESEISFNKAFIKLPKINETTMNSIDNYVSESETLTSITYSQSNADDFVKQVEGVNSVVVILVVCAAALAFVVLYNLTNINIQERKSEIATIKVLGFYPREVYDYIFRENILLAILGSIVGCFFGYLLHGFVIRSVELEMTMFVRELNLASYVCSILLTLVFTLLINFAMRSSLKKIDMVESLKSVE